MSSQQQQLVNVDASRPSKRQRRHRSGGQSAPASSGLNPAVMNPMMPFMMNPMMAAAMGGMGHHMQVPPQAAGGGGGDDGGSSDDDEPEAPVAGGHAEPAPADPAVIAQRQAELALQQARAGLFTEPQTVAARDAQRINRNYATIRSLPKVGQWNMANGACQIAVRSLREIICGKTIQATQELHLN